MHRRTFLRTAGAGGLAGPLAGCTAVGRRLGRSGAVDDEPGDRSTPASRPLDAVEGRWPMFQYDAANTGSHPTAGGPRDPPTARWRVALGRGAAGPPAIADGTLVVALTGGDVVALDARDGAERWRVPLGVEDGGTGQQSAPALVDGTVYVGDSRGRVHALDVDDGASRWTRRTDGAVDSSPTVAGGAVYVGSDDGRLYALDADDGGVRWTVETGGRIHGAPAVDDGAVYAGSTDRRVYAVDAADGAERWTFETGAGVRSSPTVDGERVYVGSNDGRLYVLDVADGAERWSRLFPFASVAQSAVRVDDLVLVATQSLVLHALDALTGDTRWTHSTAAVGWPVVADGTVYVGGESVRALDLVTGEHRWTRQVRGVGLAALDGALFAPAADGEVVALSAAPGGRPRRSATARRR